MTISEEIALCGKALLKLIAVIIIATVGMNFVFGVLTGFKGTTGPYPYTQGKLFNTK